MEEDKRIGNQFWKARSKHGRDKIFSTPEILEESICEYFQWSVDNPLQKQEAKVVNIGDYQSKVEKVSLDCMRAFTIQGLCHYLGVNTDYFTDFRDGLKGKTDEVSKDFSRVITWAYEVIYNQKFTGAAAGFLNANLISRDLGLADKKELEHANKDGNPFKWEIISNEAE